MARCGHALGEDRGAKDRLSEHLRAVEQGAEIIVTDRDRPIARIVPFRPQAPIMVTPPKAPFASVRGKRWKRSRSRPSVSSTELLADERSERWTPTSIPRWCSGSSSARGNPLRQWRYIDNAVASELVRRLHRLPLLLPTLTEISRRGAAPRASYGIATRSWRPRRPRLRAQRRMSAALRVSTLPQVRAAPMAMRQSWLWSRGRNEPARRA